VLPNEKSRQVVDVAAAPQGKALQIIIKDRYDNLAGSIVWDIDNAGVGKVGYDYIYSGDDMHTRESGVRFKLAADCDEIQWRRWSEWGRFPDDHISRTEGKAKARRDSKWPDVPEYVKPDWPWSLDQTEHGTADFRAGKFNIYEATLLSATGAGLRVHAQADVHVRPALTDGGVLLHILKECRLGPVTFRKGDRISGEFTVELVESDAGGNNR